MINRTYYLSLIAGAAFFHLEGTRTVSQMSSRYKKSVTVGYGAIPISIINIIGK